MGRTKSNSETSFSTALLRSIYISKRKYCVESRRRGISYILHGDTKKRELLKNPTKIEGMQQKNFVDKN